MTTTCPRCGATDCAEQFCRHCADHFGPGTPWPVGCRYGCGQYGHSVTCPTQWPPLFKGGQGRTAKDIQDSASTVLALIVILLVLIAVLVIWHYTNPRS
jgi:hypothetical protein